MILTHGMDSSPWPSHQRTRLRNAGALPVNRCRRGASALTPHASCSRSALASAWVGAARVGPLLLEPAVGLVNPDRHWLAGRLRRRAGNETDAGVRIVPMTAQVRGKLARRTLEQGRSGDDLVFGRTARTAFVRSTVRARALRAWEASGAVTPHEARHCAASSFAMTGLSVSEAQEALGHADRFPSGPRAHCDARCGFQSHEPHGSNPRGGTAEGPACRGVSHFSAAARQSARQAGRLLAIGRGRATVSRGW
jgi:hypothetical protein